MILRSLNEVLPPSGPILNALDRVDPAPSITGPGGAGGPPRPGDRHRSRRARRRRLGGAGARHRLRARGRGLGLGGAARAWSSPTPTSSPAQDDTTVTTQGGVELDATPVYYDPENDLALLRVGADLPTLPISDRAEPGADAAVLGYPENGPYAVAPARLGETRADDQRGLLRPRADRPHDRRPARHGPQRQLRRPAGRRARAGCWAPSSPPPPPAPPGGFAIPAEDVARRPRRTSAPVDTGPCTG